MSSCTHDLEGLAKQSSQRMTFVHNDFLQLNFSPFFAKCHEWSLCGLMRQHEYPTSEFSVACGQGFYSKVPLTRFWSCDIDLVMCSRHFFPFPYSKIALPKLHWWFDLKITTENLHAIPDKSYRLSFCKTILTWPICFRLKSKAVTCRCVVITSHTMSNVRRDDPE